MSQLTMNVFTDASLTFYHSELFYEFGRVENIDVTKISINENLRYVVDVKEKIVLFFNLPIELEVMNNDVRRHILNYCETLKVKRLFQQSFFTATKNALQYENKKYFCLNPLNEIIESILNYGSYAYYTILYIHELDEIDLIYDRYPYTEFTIEKYERDLTRSARFAEEYKHFEDLVDKKIFTLHDAKYMIPDVFSDKDFCTTFEELVDLPKSFIHGNVLYKRFVLSQDVVAILTEYKTLCHVVISI